MSVIKCKNCGRTTNTAASKHQFTFENNYADECFLAWENGEWVKGCAYDKADKYEKSAADHILATSENYSKTQEEKINDLLKEIE